MFDQTFSLVDLPLLLVLFGLEILLSSDNVIAISLIAHRLPKKKRLKAIWIGFFSAFIFRAILIILASILIGVIWLKILGGLYLVFLAGKHFFNSDRLVERRSTSLFKVILLVEFTDLIFAIDSILAGVALIGIPKHFEGIYPKLWIVYVGGLFGALVMRFAAGFMTKVLDRFPRLSTGAHLAISLVGCKLIIETILPPLSWFPSVFWSLFALLIISGFTQKKQYR